MTLGGYLRSHAVALVCDAALLVLLALLLPSLGVGDDATALACLCASLLLAVPLAYEYLRERPFLQQLAHVAESNAADALGKAALVDEPGWHEGDLAAGAVESAARAGRLQAEDARRDTREYREYVEAWVHEAKTPLASMRLFLANHSDQTLRPLAHELDRLDALVEQALYYARSFSVEHDYVVRPCVLEGLVRDAVRSRSHALIEAHIAVNIEGLDEAPSVPCDAKWVGFVLGQLIDNAVRYRADPARDGRSPRISFSAHVESEGSARERVLLVVADNGCGIGVADLPRVFDRGFTGENGRAYGHSTGMGLYLVRTLCEKMGLAVSAESEPGQGTCVTIAFPTMDDW